MLNNVILNNVMLNNVIRLSTSIHLEIGKLLSKVLRQNPQNGTFSKAKEQVFSRELLKFLKIASLHLNHTKTNG